MTLKLPGLKNIGNTCFFNSVLQALVYSRYLIPQTEAQGDVTVALSDALVLLRKSSKTFNPSQLFNKIQQSFQVYSRFQQQDSHELLRRLLDLVFEEKSDDNMTNIFSGKFILIITCTDCGYVFKFNLDIMQLRAIF